MGFISKACVISLCFLFFVQIGYAQRTVKLKPAEGSLMICYKTKESEIYLTKQQLIDKINILKLSESVESAHKKFIYSNIYNVLGHLKTSNGLIVINAFSATKLNNGDNILIPYVEAFLPEWLKRGELKIVEVKTQNSVTEIVVEKNKQNPKYFIYTFLSGTEVYNTYRTYNLSPSENAEINANINR